MLPGLLVSSTFAHKSITPPCVNSLGWWWCKGVGNMFITTFRPISTTWASFKTSQYCCWPTPSLYNHTSSEDKIIFHVKAQIISNWVFEHDSKFSVTTKITRSQSNRALGCGKMKESHQRCATGKSTATTWCYHVNMELNLRNYSAPCWICEMKN